MRCRSVLFQSQTVGKQDDASLMNDRVVRAQNSSVESVARDVCSESVDRSSGGALADKAAVNRTDSCVRVRCDIVY
jgi:hypothetical protein